jgi:Ribbon-helix-helix protein, copG family
MWKVGHVMSVTDGYGFNVTTDRGKPLVLFAYETQEAAEAAAKQVEAAVKRAVLVKPHARRRARPARRAAHGADIARLDKWAKTMGSTRSELFRALIDFGLAQRRT